MLAVCFMLQAVAQQQGTCGDGVEWNYANGVLTIRGNGAMYDYEDIPEMFADFVHSIKRVEIENGVTTIGSAVFAGTENLTTCVIPASVKSIGAYAFSGSGLTNIEWKVSEGAVAPTINVDAFDGFGNGSVTVECPLGVDYSAWSSNSVFHVVLEASGDVGTVHWDYYETTLTLSLTGTGAVADNFVATIGLNGTASKIATVTIGSGITSVGASAFSGCTGVKNVVIPATVTSIGANAFSACTAITAVTVYAAVVPALGSDAFASLKNATIVFPDESYDSYYNSDWAKYFTIAERTCGANLKWTVVEKELKITGTGAMTDYTLSNKAPWASLNSSISSISIANGVTTIGNRAFSSLSNVASVVLPSSITKLGGSAFHSNTKSIEFNSDPILGTSAVSSNAVKTLIITDGGSSNASLSATGASYNAATYTRTFAARASGTIILPFKPELVGGLKFYELTRVSDNKMVFEEVYDVKANTPYIWRNESGSNISSLSGEEKFTIETPGDASPVGDWQLKGTYVKDVLYGSDIYAYKNGGKIINYTGGLTLTPYRAYFEGPEYEETQGENQALLPERKFTLVFNNKDGETTAIENVTIDRDGDVINAVEGVYDLSGRRVENPEKGIYIVNGKKMYIK